MSEHNTESHSVSYGTYVMVWLGLVALTAVTASVAGLELGGITIVVALLIAISKSFLVGNYFMHLKFEKAIFRIFVAVCIITFLVIIILTFSDLSFR
jgi:cytochrome c oxidase subunit 4